MTQTSKYSQDVEATVFGVFVGLTIKAGLDSACAAKADWPIVDPHCTLPWWSCDTALPQFAVFLLTVIRFTYGTYRVREAVTRLHEEQARFHQLRSFVASLVIFLFFYVAGRHVQHPRTFYFLLVLIHTVGIVTYGWKAVSLRHLAASRPLAKQLRTVAVRFLKFDLATAATLSLLLAVTSPPMLACSGAIFMVLVAAIDLWLNRAFFFVTAGSLASRPLSESSPSNNAEVNWVTSGTALAARSRAVSPQRTPAVRAPVDGV